MRIHIAGTLAVACAVSACGGGGGGSGTWLRVQPSSMTMQAYQGDPVEFAITATQVGDVDPGDGELHIGIWESEDVLQPGYEVVAVDNADWLANLHLRTDLTPGTHKGTFELRLCHDPDIATCARPWPGSPWVIPFTFTVFQGLDLKPLTKLPDAGPWATFGGNPNHTGYVPAPVLDKANFDRRWGFTDGAATVTGVAVDSGRVFVVTMSGDGFDRPSKLYAIRESDGQVEWSKTLGSAMSVGAPAAANGQVYVAMTYGGYGGGLHAFDQATGEEASSAPFGTYGGNVGTPEVYGGMVYSQLGGLGGLISYDPAAKTANWYYTVGGGRVDAWSPAVDGTYVYGIDSGLLGLWKVEDGSWVTYLSDATGDYARGTGGGLVLDGSGHAYNSYIEIAGTGTEPGRLVSYSVGTAQPSVGWSVTSTFRSAPVLANGVLYVIDGDALEARSPSTGAKLWSWSPRGGLGAETNTARYLTVVGNKAIVDGGWYTFIVDLSTRTIDYAYPAAGPIAVSANGVAYVSGRNGALIAINLQ